MTISLGMVTFDTTDAPALARWWARQTGGTVDSAYGDGFVLVRAVDDGPVLGFQQVPDPTPGKNRVHLDLAAPDREAEVERLLADGATLVARRGTDDFPWVVLADPDGNQFCVAQADDA
ncbi:VOC family protein [Cellulomonas sp. HZM]|uniref:VOC family protein n=1 Tax=Cellulomonas sp. HZM TaxID=1454010 RepID=UPI0004938E9A|nr:VOC family protein [Cellulomonas sp. HZM]